MNLLIITEEGEDDEVRNHYVLIKDFKKLMYNLSKHKERKHFCMRCSQCFSSEGMLERHVEVCFAINGAQAIVMPKEGSTREFGHYGKVLSAPFVIYADFGALNEMVETIDESYGNQYQRR